MYISISSNEECRLLSILYDQLPDVLRHGDKFDVPPSLRVLARFSQYRLEIQALLLAQG